MKSRRSGPVLNYLIRFRFILVMPAFRLDDENDDHQPEQHRRRPVEADIVGRERLDDAQARADVCDIEAAGDPRSRNHW